MKPISNMKVYDLEETLVASGYAMIEYYDEEEWDDDELASIYGGDTKDSQKAIASSGIASSFNAITVWILSLNVSTPILIPKPNSALSSNNELAQAGPRPSAFVVYGLDG